jgi:uncharacterized protein
MLKVDLAELARKKRYQIDGSLPADHAPVAGAGFHLVTPLAMHLEVREAEDDVVVTGRVEGEAEVACRRCLAPVRVPIDQDVTLVFRAGVSQVEAEAEEVYPLPERGNVLDLTGPLREHLLLAVPDFLECREECKGLCPHCGVDLNETTCSCEHSQGDDRWAALKQLTNKE